MAIRVKTKTGDVVPLCSVEQVRQLRDWQSNILKLDQNRVVEGAAFSFAMVVRYALGLSAEGGTIGALVRDSLAGHVVLATVRHLINAGAAGAQIVVISDNHAVQSEEMATQLGLVARLGANVFDYEPSGDDSDFEKLLKSCHNLLVGTFLPHAHASDSHLLPLINILNDLPTPGHCVEMPFGTDPDSGQAGNNAMFASSTLSLGIPLSGCSAASDRLGRHYLADCGFTLEQYRELGYVGPPLFSDQPVIQLIHDKESND